MAGGWQAVEEHIAGPDGDRISAMTWHRTIGWVGDSGCWFAGHTDLLIDLHLAATIQARGETDFSLETVNFQQAFNTEGQPKLVVVPR